MGHHRSYMRHMLVVLSAIYIFCFMVVGHVNNSLHCFNCLVVVMCICIFHCSDGTRLIPR